MEGAADKVCLCLSLHVAERFTDGSGRASGDHVWTIACRVQYQRLLLMLYPCNTYYGNSESVDALLLRDLSAVAHVYVTLLQHWPQVTGTVKGNAGWAIGNKQMESEGKAQAVRTSSS